MHINMHPYYINIKNVYLINKKRFENRLLTNFNK